VETPASTHPADETLVSYGLGKLDETVADRVSKHLEECAPCRQRVADLSGDSFVGRLRQAQPQPAQPQPAQPVPRAKTLVEDVPQGGARSKVSEKQSSILGKLASSQDSDSSPESGSALPPELVDHPHYEVIRELGRGGMGVVYLARNKLMDRLEVLKLLSQEMLGKPERVERFLREIQAAAKLHHPNVVAAYTAFPLGKLLVFAMEYVEGDDLAKLVRARGPLPVLNACYFAYQTALGLQHAHERGMIHRDIKPGNLILFRQGKKGTVKILDFGLAKLSSEQKIDRTLTHEGQMLGTPDYIAPEQTLDAQKADIRSDIYSLGCTLYHLLTGNPPFSGSSLYAVLQAHHADEARMVNLVRPEVPVELAAVVAKMMAKDPSRRYQTPAEVAQALKPFLKPGGLTSQSPQPAPPVSQIDRPSSVPIAAGAAADEEEEPALVPMQEIEASERWKSLIDAPSLTPSGPRPAIRKLRRRQTPWILAAIATLALLFGLVIAWAGGVFKVKTADGIIVLEDLPDNAEVYVDNEKVTVHLSKGSAEITVPPGKHGVQVAMGGIQVFGKEVTVASGEKTPLKVRLEPRPQTASTPREFATTRTPTETNQPDLLVAPFNEEKAKAAQERWATRLGSPVVMPNSIGMKLTLIPPGRFAMGSAETVDEVLKAFPAQATDGPWAHPLGERPVHPVTISRPFYLGTYEVTKGQFERFVRDAGYRTDAEKDGRGAPGYSPGDDLPKFDWHPNFNWREWGGDQPDDAPVVNISHNDAVAFCVWLSKQEGKTYRLPTEAEWEYACRAGTLGRYYSGDDPEELTKIGNVADATLVGKFPGWAQGSVESSDGYAFPSPVGRFRPNNFGLYDMLGNAWEWCADWYDEEYYLKSPPLDPPGPQSGQFRVRRGGSWSNAPMADRAAKRMGNAPDHRQHNEGFRVACDLVPSVREPAKSTANDQRRVWQGYGKSSFRNTGGGKWREEVHDGSAIYNFDEVARTPQYVELIDKTRAVGGCRIRLLDSESQIIWGQRDKNWRHHQFGKWEGSAHFGTIVPLFNGKDLAGWTAIENEGSWKVDEEGILVGQGSRQAGKPLVLIADQAKYKDFKLSIRILNAENAPISAIIRRSASGSQYSGYGIMLSDTQNGDLLVRRGSLYRADMLKLGVALTWNPIAKPSHVGEWYTLEITAIGNHITTSVNGTVVAEYEDPKPFESGGLALVGRNDVSVQIREIKIQELGGGLGGTKLGKREGLATATESQDDDSPKKGGLGQQGGLGGFGFGIGGLGRSDDANGLGFGPATKEKFVRLFNGEDFTNWTFPKGGEDKWSVENGVLRCVAIRLQRLPSPDAHSNHRSDEQAPDFSFARR